MNLRDLKYFLAVAELKHFGQAAKRCGVSQPTLSGQIRKLEDTLGITLFERNNRTVNPTPLGESIAEVAREITQAEQRIYDIANTHEHPFDGQLRIGVFPTLAPYLLPKLVTEIRAQLPKLKLLLLEEKTENLIDALSNGQLDLAIMALPIPVSQFSHEVIFTEPFYLAVPNGHPLAGLTEIKAPFPPMPDLMLLDEGHCLRDQALEFCGTSAIQITDDFRATSLETLKEMVRTGTGMTFVPEIAIERHRNGVVYIPFDTSGPTRTIAVFWRNTYPNLPLVNQISTCLRRSYQ